MWGGDFISILLKDEILYMELFKVLLYDNQILL